ncbi:hypothetical protein REPUB_Repub01dG0245000 [Reevesia pubescens]
MTWDLQFLVKKSFSLSNSHDQMKNLDIYRVRKGIEERYCSWFTSFAAMIREKLPKWNRTYAFVEVKKYIS